MGDLSRTPARRHLLVLALFCLILDSCGSLPPLGAAPTREDALLVNVSIYANLMTSQSEWQDASVRQGGKPPGLAARRADGDVNAVLLLIAQTAAWCNQTRDVILQTMPAGPRETAVAELDGKCSRDLANLERRAKALESGGRRSRSWWRRTVAGRFLGWVGRDVLKPALPDVALVAFTGGGGLAAKRIVLRQGRRALEKEARGWAGRVLARKGVKHDLLELAGLPPGPDQLSQVATAGPIEAVEPVEEGPAVTLSAEEWAELIAVETEPAATEDVFELPKSGLWTAVCKHRWIEPEWTFEWKLGIDLGSRTFTHTLAAARDVTETGGYWRRHETWEEQGSGTIAEDGILEGEYLQTESYTVTYLATGESFTHDPEVAKYPMYGTFSSDLKRVCMSRGLQPGAFDPAYVRRLGRDLFFGPDKGCEGECTIVGSP